MPRFMNVTASAGLRARSQPDTTAPIITLIPNQSRVWVVNETPKWAQLVLEVGNVACGLVWASKDYLVSDTPQGTPPGAEYILGVHELAHGKSREALQRGARCVMVFNDATEAITLSKMYPSAIVMHRVYFTDPPSPKELLARHGIDVANKIVSDSRAYIRIFNESDSPGFDMSLDGLRRRAAYESECLLMLQDYAPNAKLVVGGFAHGNPDITKPEVCALINELYAGWYNERKVWMDLHNYSLSEPGNPKNYRFYGDEWFIARYIHWFTKCGFDLNVRQCLASESGAECGHGGTKWAGFTDDEFLQMCVYFLSVHKRPLVMNGQEYVNPLAGATLFQVGNDYTGAGGWWGYNVEDKINPVLQPLWIPSSNLPLVDAMTSAATRTITLDNVPPVGYHPVIKRLIQSKRK